MDVTIKLPDGNKLDVLVDDKTTVFDLKRIIRDKTRNDILTDDYKMTPYRINLIYKNKMLTDSDILSDNLIDDDTKIIHFVCRLVGGPVIHRTQQFMIHIDMDEFKDVLDFVVMCSPHDTIGYLLKYVLEHIYITHKHTLTTNNITVTYNNELLHSSKYFAEYKKISRSFVIFNNHDDVINEKSVVGHLMKNHSDYYHLVEIGDREDDCPYLIISNKCDTIYGPINSKCCMCNTNDYHIIEPIKRDKLCNKCATKRYNI